MLVKNIQYKNNKIEVVLEETSFFISKENYIENPIAVDSDLSDERVSYLLKYEKVVNCKMEMIKILNKKALSEYEVFLKLKEKDISYKDIKKIVDDLKRAGLINDEFVALINLENLIVKRKGKREIRKILKEKRISDEIIENVIQEIDVEVYLDNFNKMTDKYLKMYEKKSFKLRESMLKRKLEELGYEEDLISTVNVIKDNDGELELAKNTFYKLTRNKNIDLNSYENINKIKLKLLTKGFSYDIINLVLEEVKNDETY